MYRPTNNLSRKQMAALLAMLVAVMPFSMDAYLPALPQIATSLNSNIHHIEKSVSSFIFGVALGQILGGSLSDIKGRRNIALIGLLIYIISSAGLIFIQTHQQLMFMRIIQAIGAGMSVVTVGAIVRDHYQGKEAAQMFALIGVIMMLAPLAGPVIGSFLQGTGGWRSIFLFLFAYGLLATIIVFLFLPQTKPAEPITTQQIKQIGSRYLEVITNREALGFLFYQAASFASLLVFLSESPFVYMELYGISPHHYAWFFGGNIIIMITCNRLTAFGLKHNWHSRNLLKIGIVIQQCANISLVILVLIFQKPSLWFLAPLIMISVGTQGLIVANTQSLFMSNFKPEVGGSANAILSSGQSLIGSLIGFTATILHNGTASIMVNMMLVATIIGTVLLFSCSHKQMFDRN